MAEGVRIFLEQYKEHGVSTVTSYHDLVTTSSVIYQFDLLSTE